MKRLVNEEWFGRVRQWAAPPHPTWQSSSSRDRVGNFLQDERVRVPHGMRVNVGSASKRLGVKMVNLDLFRREEVDLQGDLRHLPLQSQSVDTLVCTGVLEHIHDPQQAVKEMSRVLKDDGRVFFETPFMQTVHASPDDYSRWTPNGLRQLFQGFDMGECEVVAGPASALAWQLQETMAMLFSFRSHMLYKVGLRVFGWLAIPVSWLDRILEQHPFAWHAASGYAVVGVKKK
ncbi:MAG: hypothetical protein NPIRA05_08030 [Nitrospirales bacterium]|nr:MAG: hypothetical protein NPIRA05_08030 [Nitrospirales bacterium]